MPELEKCSWCEGDSPGHMVTDMDMCTHRQVGQRLTLIPLLVPCNLERKHCSAHSLAGWPNGSRQRAGQ